MRHIFQSVFKDGQGRIIPSATVSVYLAGTTTAANIYTAAAGGSPVTSVTTASDGSFSFFVSDSDFSLNQKFKITMTKTDFATKSYDNITIFAPVPTGVFYPDANATDQGAATTGGYSLKDIIDAAGSNNITIKLRNSSGSATTSYTLTTSETIPATCSIELEIGAMITQGGSAVLTINGPVVGNPMHQWLSGFNPGDVTLPKSIPARPEFWGAVGDGTADDTVALNCAWKSNNTLKLGSKAYGTTGLLFAVASATDHSLDGLRITGNGIFESSINLLTGSSNNYVLKFQGSAPETPQTLNNFIDSLYMSDLTLVGGIVKTGVDGFCLYRPTFHNIKSLGQNYGFKLRSCIMTLFSGITSVDYCNVGIKVPEYITSGATIDNYNWGINVTNIESLFARSCIKASISLGCGGVISITNMLGENVPVSFYMYGYCNNISVNSLGLENNTTPSINDNSVKDKRGNYQHWLLYTGIDEDGVVYGTNDIYNINFKNTGNLSQGSCHLKNCHSIRIIGITNEASLELEGTCSDIVTDSFSISKKTNTIIPGVGRPTSKRNALKSGFNLIANGLNTYPNMPGYDPSSGTIIKTTTTLDNGSIANVMRMTLPPGQANTVYQIRLPRTYHGDYDNPGQMKILVEAHVKASTALVTNIAVKLTAHDTAYQLGLANLTDYTNPALSSNNWNVITVEGTTAITDTNTGCWLYITATRTNTSGTDYLYIADLIARDASLDYINTPSVFDVLAGFCYKGTTVDYGGAGFYVQFTVPDGLYYIEYYEVIATAYGTTQVPVSVVKGNGYFRVHANASGISVVAQLIPLQAISA